jgi:hypothetical protein
MKPESVDNAMIDKHPMFVMCVDVADSTRQLILGEKIIY